MKGIVFTEFFELVDDKFSIETSENLIQMSNLPSEGVYTSVGTYDVQEMMTLVRNLSTITNISVADLLKTFGKYLFNCFLRAFPDFFVGIRSSLDFLPRVQGYVHLEVKKLYPDADLPSFSCAFPKPGTLVMTYNSKHALADLAEGLILACIEHFGESLSVKRENFLTDLRETRFIIAQKQEQ
jgi:hypothetical protein